LGWLSSIQVWLCRGQCGERQLFRALFDKLPRQRNQIMNDALPAIARKLYHCRDIGEPFDFLTWFEYAPSHANAFEDLVGRLRETAEWKYVEREIDLRLMRV